LQLKDFEQYLDASRPFLPTEIIRLVDHIAESVFYWHTQLAVMLVRDHVSSASDEPVLMVRRLVDELENLYKSVAGAQQTTGC
jgi:hypothetical protein